MLIFLQIMSEKGETDKQVPLDWSAVWWDRQTDFNLQMWELGNGGQACLNEPIETQTCMFDSKITQSPFSTGRSSRYVIKERARQHCGEQWQLERVRATCFLTNDKEERAGYVWFNRQRCFHSHPHSYLSSVSRYLDHPWSCVIYGCYLLLWKQKFNNILLSSL